MSTNTIVKNDGKGSVISNIAHHGRGLRRISVVLMLAWGAAYSVFLGAYAHGMHKTIEDALNAVFMGLILLAALLQCLRPKRVGGTSLAHVVRAVAGVAVLLVLALVIEYLGYQTGLALHEPPRTFAEFFTAVP